MWNASRRLWRDMAVELLDRDGLDTVFSHARNVLTGAAIIAAGRYAARHLEDQLSVDLRTLHLAGYGVAALGVLLLVLNLVDGLRRLARRQHPLLLRCAAIFVYVVLSVRLTQVVIYFRSAA